MPSPSGRQNRVEQHDIVAMAYVMVARQLRYISWLLREVIAVERQFSREAIGPLAVTDSITNRFFDKFVDRADSRGHSAAANVTRY